MRRSPRIKVVLPPATADRVEVIRLRRRVGANLPPASATVAALADIGARLVDDIDAAAGAPGTFAGPGVTL